MFLFVWTTAAVITRVDFLNKTVQVFDLDDKYLTTLKQKFKLELSQVIFFHTVSLDVTV